MNTFKTIFKGYDKINLKMVPKLIEHFANDKIKIAMSRKLQFLTLVGINDPFFELLGWIRNQNIIKNK